MKTKKQLKADLDKADAAWRKADADREKALAALRGAKA